jgi:hypothetical protein
MPARVSYVPTRWLVRWDTVAPTCWLDRREPDTLS